MNKNKSFASFTADRNYRSIPCEKLEILYRDDFLAIVDKPAGMASQPGKRAGSNVITAMSDLINIPADKIFLVNRLDQPVSGLMLIAFSADIQTILNQQQKMRKIIKQYLAVTISGPEGDEGKLTDYLSRDGTNNTSKIVAKEKIGSKHAVLYWKKISGMTILLSEHQNIRLSLLEIRLETGRHHQIRAQLSGNGWPILGDTKYYNAAKLQISQNSISQAIDKKLRSAGRKNDQTSGIALLSRKIEFEHPISKEKMKFVLPYPTIGSFCLFADKQNKLDREQSNNQL